MYFFETNHNIPNKTGIEITRVNNIPSHLVKISKLLLPLSVKLANSPKTKLIGTNIQIRNFNFLNALDNTL